jgi:methylenetetrahydrofolate dehydrogenase (NADP+)/methenyltetrahydrofolate cyclohydrolase
MSAKILEGKTLAGQIKRNLENKISVLKNKHNKIPCLFAVDAGYDKSSSVYLQLEIAACRKLGIKTELKKITPDISADNFTGLIEKASKDDAIDAILIPKPLPQHLNDINIWSRLNPDKDIDGGSLVNMGKLFYCKSSGEIQKNDFFVPCTALAVVKLIEYYGISVEGMSVAVLGRSATVGRPLAHMLTCLNATVTLCHSKTKNLASVLKNCDMVISAIGKARFITQDMVNSKSIVIDVGTNTDAKGVFCGDADFDKVAKKAAAITPVPGGVGPVTLACLLENIVKSALRGLNN